MKNSIKYNKLVRDKIPTIIKRNKGDCSYHFANDNEFKEKLFEKLQEEINEFTNNPSAEEFADILEVLDSIRILNSIPIEEIREIKINKKKKNGGFNLKVILDEATKK